MIDKLQYTVKVPPVAVIDKLQYTVKVPLVSVIDKLQYTVKVAPVPVTNKLQYTVKVPSVSTILTLLFCQNTQGKVSFDKDNKKFLGTTFFNKHTLLVNHH